MKYRFYKGLMLGALLLAGSLPALHAQGFSVPWFVVADGGGTTGAGIFSLTGTFGQWEANEQPLAGGNFSLTGGFWSFLAAEPAPGASNSASAIALSGNLAFGGVALETSSNLTFTISNAGNSTLTITNIRYPAGFSGSSFGQILAGGAQSVTVTFSPTDVIVYGGAVTVSSDETNGIGSIPISGYGASGALTLIVITKGDGTVSPNLNGKLLRAGTKHNLTATAKSGNVFSIGPAASLPTRTRSLLPWRSARCCKPILFPIRFCRSKGRITVSFSRQMASPKKQRECSRG